jgi:hypothetical protein
MTMTIIISVVLEATSCMCHNTGLCYFDGFTSRIAIHPLPQGLAQIATSTCMELRSEANFMNRFIATHRGHQQHKQVRSRSQLSELYIFEKT